MQTLEGILEGDSTRDVGALASVAYAPAPAARPRLETVGISAMGVGGPLIRAWSERSESGYRGTGAVKSLK
jgi:hypothetical protein